LRRIRWSPAAAADLEGIRLYLYEHHPSYIESTIRTLYDAARSLKQMPHRGRAGRKAGTRELVLNPLPYTNVYGVEPDMVHIFRILHAAKDRL
jgi:plasmid stabilization system protein ParE